MFYIAVLHAKCTDCDYRAKAESMSLDAAGKKMGVSIMQHILQEPEHVVYVSHKEI